ncbi:MAG TPA: phospholipid carrier-dependent glycosyltransferase, partial [Deltaproteobacteria bacterium]|nr:phospholipid carrier-dependent glycosyltransferase [Deltaproteobacteria bacterium]
FKVLGVNELAARLPSVLAAAATAALTFRLARRAAGLDAALAACLILSSTVLFFITAGAVLTDTVMVLGTTLSMAAFWLAVGEGGGRLWSRLFFVGLAVGLLAKGPVAAVLTLAPVSLWVLFKGKWGLVRRRIGWVEGAALMVLIAAPWYVAAQWKTPGFIEYFIVGEHWKRFTEAGWSGDLYGNPHVRTRGTIIAYWLGAVLPWTPVLAVLLVKRLRRGAGSMAEALGGERTLYLLLWAAAPVLFFLPARNILPTYVQPGLPAFAVLLAESWLARDEERPRASATLAALGLVVPLLFVTVLFSYYLPYKAPYKSQKTLVEHYEEVSAGSGARLDYLFDRPFSAQFYTRGRARRYDDADLVRGLSAAAVGDYFAVRSDRYRHLPERLRAGLEEEGVYGSYTLLRKTAGPGHRRPSAKARPGDM